MLLEGVAEPAAVGAGILLQPNGLAVLNALGLGEELRRAAWRTPPSRTCAAVGCSTASRQGSAASGAA